MSTHPTHPHATPLRRPARRPPDDPRVGGPRGYVAIARGLNFLAGIWLIIAPFVLGYRSADPYWNDIVFGVIVAFLAAVRVSGASRASELSWANALIGVWLFVSAFWLDSSGRASWNDVILGAIVFLLAMASGTASSKATAMEVNAIRDAAAGGRR